MKESTITRRVIFHTGHMLKDDVSKCHNPHGHEYVLDVSLTGPIQEEGQDTGMVMNFGDLKGLMMEHIHDTLDHKFILENADPRTKDFCDALNWEGVITVPFSPTAENLTAWIYKELLPHIIAPAYISKIRLQETSNCWVDAEFPSPTLTAREVADGLLDVTPPKIGL
jgi:6-pyruvoyltetrahydropterin/6-carboxytetrahydropterin synthase